MTIETPLKKSLLIGLGSNIGNPVQQVKNALQALSLLTGIRLIKASALYQSLPQGPQDQPSFCNAVALIETNLSPTQLLLALQALEQQFGRVKTRHWGERCIDLDILFQDQDVISAQSPELTIPHPHALSRDFVLIPALEICPNWRLPDGSLLAGHLTTCLDHHLQRIE